MAKTAIRRKLAMLGRGSLPLLAALLAAGWTGPASGGSSGGPPRIGDSYAGVHIPHSMPAVDVLIDAGHGGIDGGTHWGPILEKDINLAISRKLYLILRSRGIRAALNRTGDYALSEENRWHRASRHNRDLSQRGGLSEELLPGMFVSIHVNWSPRRRSRGPIVIHQDEGRSALLAALIQNGLNRQQQSNKLPVRSRKYYMLNRVKVPSVIVETAFLSDAGDREMLTSPRGQTRVAMAIAEGILAYRCVSP